jgi:hypothetical protein
MKVNIVKFPQDSLNISQNNLIDSCQSGVIKLDAFTVLLPTEFYAYPIENYSFDILNGKLEQDEGSCLSIAATHRCTG